ncbi:hypothetical protein CfE428DRAFT_4205 [Chthoniobacter flavus Ellin428]|uniref:Uncharacterized protein n=1 Tax=Chthoniobacter flavus Ellin428 TaxID=497964 RepID=B4D5L6_9BACT|nr:hypothetical protein [Chthoniobacter flavus]EDY18421.1 hypothetical protein CfE428DRAFT_4205 [Chthoniobacter flavus Ellin428]TCO90870.1 hypothetical protein EV701_10919 [Chthoniobacter flavus]
MPDADALLMQAQQAQRIIVETQAAEDARLEYTKHANTAGRLYRLKTNDDFIWFLQEFVEPLIEAEDKILNDLETPTARRDIACQRKHIARVIRGLAEAKHTEFLAKANPN